MERSKRETNPTPEEQELKERVMRARGLVSQEGSVGVCEEFRKLSSTREGRRKFTVLKKVGVFPS